MPCTVYVYAPDTDATYRAALAAGATPVMEPANQFYGDRNAGVKDSNGNQWWMGTHVEDVPPKELERRMAEALKETRGRELTEGAKITDLTRSNRRNGDRTERSKRAAF